MEDKTLSIYVQYRDLVEKTKQAEDAKETSKDIHDFFEKESENIVMGYLYNRLLRNVEGKLTRRGQPFSFFTNDATMKNVLADPSLLTKLRENVANKIDHILAKLPTLSKETVNESKIFKYEVVIDHYFDTKKNYYFYFDYRSKDVLEAYYKIYQKELVQGLKKLYDKEEIYRQINTDRLMIAKADDFEEENSTSTMGIKNLSRLVYKLVTSFEEGRKLLSDDEVIFINQVNIVQKMIMMTTEISEASKKDREPSKTASSKHGVDRETEENIKNLFIKLLKGSVQHEEYIGFFVKEDYLRWGTERHPNVSNETLSNIFDSVVSPKTPIGVTRFVIPDSSAPDGKRSYFIALSHITFVFNKIDVKKYNDLSRLMNIKDRHFFVFLKKMLGDFDNLHYSDEKIAGMLMTTPKLVDEMRTTVKKMIK